jgi:hypothetical protein
MHSLPSRIFGAACFITLAVGVVACGSISVSSNDGGASGSTGHAGSTTGGAGATGAAGATGSAGASGTAGVTGTAGQGGTTGAAGHGGASGTAGTTGSAGVGGATGTAGAGGATGSAGAGGIGGSGGMTGSAGSGGAGTGGTCLRTKGCCSNDLDCVAADECVGGTCSATAASDGVCKPRPTMRNNCWSDADCKALVLTPKCNGASVCPCRASCLLADKMGTCQKLLTPDPTATTN